MEKRLPLIKIQLVWRLCGSLCMAGGMLGRFEEGPSLEPRLYKLSFVLSCCSKQKFTNVRTGSRAGVGKQRLVSSCDWEDAVVRQQRAFCSERGKKKRNSPGCKINTFSLLAGCSKQCSWGYSSTGRKSEDMWIHLSFRGINCLFWCAFFKHTLETKS